MSVLLVFTKTTTFWLYHALNAHQNPLHNPGVKDGKTVGAILVTSRFIQLVCGRVVTSADMALSNPHRATHCVWAARLVNPKSEKIVYRVGVLLIILADLTPKDSLALHAHQTPLHQP